MPIVFVHGVANRMHQGYAEDFASLQKFLLRYVAPAISSDPASVRVLDAYWGDLGATFAWDRASRPRSKILGMGPEAAPDLARMSTYAEYRDELEPIPVPSDTPAASTGGLISAGTSDETTKLSDMPPEELSDLFAAILTSMAGPNDDLDAALIAADELAHDAAFRAELAALEPDAQLARFQDALDDRAGGPGGLLGQGSPWLSRLGDRAKEVLDYGVKSPGWAATRVLVEARKPLNEMATLFLGDVFVFLKDENSQNRQAIIDRVMKSLREADRISKQRGGEPIVVLSHSMGGQLMYEIVTSVLPNAPGDDGQIRIDLWCASASQVGLFEELKLFSVSSDEHSKANGKKVPFPGSNLGAWWNVWDSNDVLSFTAGDIFEGIEDEEFNSGLSIAKAHGGYLVRPTFFRKLASKVEAATGGA